MGKYTFRECTQSKLTDWFGLHRTFSNQILASWLDTQMTLSEKEKDMVKTHQKGLLISSDAWNEQELALHFIGPIFALVHFIEPYRFNLFAARHIKATVPGLEEDIQLSGEPDGLIATGYWEPKIPMFAFSEYKRNLDPDGDPAGQTLAAMLVGQVLNEQPIPLYGCYVVGYDWRFLVLKDKHYIISRNYSALTDEVFDIFRILKALKLIIIDLTAE